MRTKKFAFQLLVLFVIAATLLSACGGAATEAPAAATEAPVVEAPAATEAPVMTEAPVVDPMAELYCHARLLGKLWRDLQVV